jgi:hypothetical protein
MHAATGKIEAKRRRFDQRRMSTTRFLRRTMHYRQNSSRRHMRNWKKCSKSDRLAFDET